jgi:hypothetical protein
MEDDYLKKIEGHLAEMLIYMRISMFIAAASVLVYFITISNINKGYQTTTYDEVIIPDDGESDNAESYYDSQE